MTLQVRATAHGPIITDVSDFYGDLAGSGRRLRRPCPCAWTASDACPRDRRRDLRPRHRDRLDELPRGGLVVRGAGAEHRVRRPRRPHRLPGSRPGPDPQVRATTASSRRRAGAARTTGPATTCRSTGLPHVLDPDEGFVVTANQAVIGPDYPYHLTDDWDQGYRSQRIRDLLERRIDDAGHAVGGRHGRDPDRHPQPDRADARPAPARRRPAARLLVRRPATAAPLGLRPARRQRAGRVLQRRLAHPAAT